MTGRIAGVLTFVALVGGISSAAPVPPGGMQTYTLTLPFSPAAAGFVGPGSKIDVLATMRNGNKLEAFPLIVDVLVVAVNATVKDGVTGPMTISVSVTDKQAKVLALAQRRACALEALLRNPDNKGEDKNHNLDAVIKKLSAVEVAPAPRLIERK